MSKGLMRLMISSSRRKTISPYWNHNKDDYVKNAYPKNYKKYMDKKYGTGNWKE